MIRRVVIVLTLVALALSLAALTGCRGKNKVPLPMTGMAGAGGVGGTNRPMDDAMAGAEQVPAELMPVVYFDYDSPNIRADQVARLQQSADYLSKNGSVKVRIEGNCDERGTTEYNMGLGGKRADAIAAYLVSRGVSRDRLTTLSRGQENPADPSHNEAAWAKNRRGEFFYTAK